MKTAYQPISRGSLSAFVIGEIRKRNEGSNITKEYFYYYFQIYITYYVLKRLEILLSII